ncbi:hypothetical protein T11_13016 [Trichinella zimbabwensis]|uniref:MULE transposase domain-containing protein n=1 Tax=Trichinella zimbabwensis TaxID=268475 RepID=A0A0V1GTI6_9BILA|nr:hypothetical protein T11_13016 [Trichinella zimbabwensis]
MADVSELRLVATRSGSMSLVYEGRVYKLRYTGLVYFGIKQRRLKGCHMDKPGCDICDHEKRSHRKLPANLKKRSAEETKSIPAIYDEEASVASAVPSTSDHFPLFKRVKSMMYNHRLKCKTKLAVHRRDMQIPDAFMTTKAREKFLLWQNALRHILTFATGSNIRLLAARRTWGMDSTFKGAPQWYQQLFTIHAFVAGKLVPAVYCLCTGKDIGTYGYILFTNNDLEGWHNGLNRKADKIYNGFYELLQLLIAEQGVMDTLVQQVESGNATVGDLRRVNKVYAEKQQRVHNIRVNTPTVNVRWNSSLKL